MLRLVYVSLIVSLFSYQSEVSIVPNAAPDMPLPFPLHLTDTISALSYDHHADDDDDDDGRHGTQLPYVETDDTRLLKEAISTFHQLVSNSIKSLNVLQNSQKIPLFLSNNVKFTIQPAANFINHLEKCALAHGHLPYDYSQLQNAIDKTEVPEKIFMSQKPLYENMDMQLWSSMIDSTPPKCSVWQKSGPFNSGLGKILDDHNCEQLLPTLCLDSVGQNTFYHHTMTREVQKQLSHQMHFFLYLLSQLSLYPKPSQHFASDIAKHIADSLQHFRDNVQLNIRGNKISYGMISSMELCLSYIQLALQKSTHSEHWLANIRQNKNFHDIKRYTDRLEIILNKMGVADDKDDNSGLNHDDGDDGHDHNDGHDDGDDNEDDHAPPPIPPSTTEENDQNNDNHNNNRAKDNHNDDGAYDDHGDNDDQDDQNITTHHTNQTNTSTMSWYQYVRYLLTSDRLSNETTSFVSDPNVANTTTGPGYDPDNPYFTDATVQLWPLLKFVTLSTFHLAAMINFLIDILFKICFLLLVVYTLVLSYRIEALHKQVQQLDPTKITPEQIRLLKKTNQ